MHGYSWFLKQENIWVHIGYTENDVKTYVQVSHVIDIYE